MAYDKTEGASLPSWERGLKQLLSLHRRSFTMVAPLVGAWIETTENPKGFIVMPVAPLVGAWIETIYPNTILCNALCRSPRGSVD